MIVGLDHVVIGVPDLDEAVKAYRDLGFDVRMGGRHVGRGTHNALIRFGPDYLELMSVFDGAEAATDPFAASLLRFLDGRVGGLIGYVLACDDVSDLRERMTASEMTSVGPLAMSRRRPDGALLSWKMLIPGEISWRRPLPTVIEWDQPASERGGMDGPSAHPNGATHIRSVSVAVRELEATAASFARGFGLMAGPASGVARLAAQERSIALANVGLRLLAPAGKGTLGDALDRDGEGPFEVVLEGPSDQRWDPRATMGAAVRVTRAPRPVPRHALG